MVSCGLKLQHTGYCLPVAIKVAPYMSSFQTLKQAQVRKCGMGWGKRNCRALENPLSLQWAVCRRGSAKGSQAWGESGFGSLGSWRLPLPLIHCVASNAKERMRGTWLQPGTAGRSSAVLAGFGYGLFASPGEKGKATLRLPPMLLVINNSDGCRSQKKLT